MEGNAFVYQVYPVSRIFGEGGADFSRAWGPEFGQEKRGGGNGRGNSICARKLKILQGDKSDGCIRNASVSHVYPVICTTTGEERAENPKGWRFFSG